MMLHAGVFVFTADYGHRRLSMVTSAVLADVFDFSKLWKIHFGAWRVVNLLYGWRV